jgi:hypothetical protein
MMEKIEKVGKQKERRKPTPERREDQPRPYQEKALHAVSHEAPFAAPETQCKVELSPSIQEYL